MVQALCIAAVSSVYYPAKYRAILEFWLKLYLEVRSPLSILQSYLNLYTSGSVKTKLGSFENGAWDPRRAFVGPVGNVLRIFGQESILIWVAVLLKKRIFVFGEDRENLLTFMQGLPCLGGWHRQDWR